MITSAELTFSDNQAITATAASTNYVDLGDPGTPYKGNKLIRDIGPGEPIPLEAMITEAFNNLTSVEVQVQVADDTGFSVGLKTVMTETILLADAAVGKNINFPFVPHGVDQRYLRLNYVVVGTAPTTGKFWAGISGGRQTNK